MEMDTDSLYAAFARPTIDECVKPEMRELWKDEKWKWFCLEDETRDVEFRGSMITRKEHDRRTPGKFKEEYRGVGMACINSKTYIIWQAINPQGSSKAKSSAKSVQQKRNHLAREHFLDVLTTKEPKMVENAGFIRNKEGIIQTYTQYKKGMTFFYAKRKVLPDNVSTTHLDI